MSLTTEPQSKPNETSPVARNVLGPGGNRIRVSDPSKPASPVKAAAKKHPGAGEKPPAAAPKKNFSKMPREAVRKNASVDSLCSTDSTSSASSLSSSSSSTSLSAGSGKTASSSRRKVRVSVPGVLSANSARDAVDSSPTAEPGPFKRCDWITVHSEPLYVSFHDEEWGVPVHDDAELFELLVLSIALAEHTWVSILSKRDSFRKLFHDFHPASVATLSEEKILSLSSGGNALLSEPKLRAISENAKQVLKVQEEFGSFSSYCWRFVNNNPMRNGYRYARQVPVKTPKAEMFSKDLIRRGFRCVGPTVVYSFMQVCGMVNDHLMSCFRYNKCNEAPKKLEESKLDGEVHAGAMKRTCISQD